MFGVHKKKKLYTSGVSAVFTGVCCNVFPPLTMLLYIVNVNSISIVRQQKFAVYFLSVLIVSFGKQKFF